LQARIDDFHRARRGRPFDVAEYERFLHDIEYLAPEPPDFSIRTANVDDEIAHIAGPQLVVPFACPRRGGCEGKAAPPGQLGARR
jgi:malate synthase